MMPGYPSLVDLLGSRAARQPDDTAYTFLDGGEEIGPSLTWAALDRRCRAIGAAVASRVPRGARVLLMYPPGLDFISGFFGCLYAGAIAVPTYPPSGSRADRASLRIRGMVADAGVSLILSTDQVATRAPLLAAFVPDVATIPWLATDTVDDSCAEAWQHPRIQGDEIAFLQYTSGSTASPRGVMVTHANLLHNLAASAAFARHDADSVSVSWLPVNHDMGLIDGVLQPAFSGFPAYLMAPAAFLQRPARWLQAISRLRATHSGGPNFAYDLCVRRVGPSDRAGLDLSAWRIAYNGSEPVRRQTLESFQRAFGECGFRWTSFRPAYGLAESTLLVASSAKDQDLVGLDVDPAALARGRVVPRPSATPLVASGAPAASTEILIVDPDRRTRCAADQVGEIWIAGPSVARGYWRQPRETDAVFNAFLVSGEGPYLRSGDLGFLHGSELFVTGRIKDVLIVRGLKHYPQDLELSVESRTPVVRPGCCAAFAIEADGEERAAIVAEVDESRGPTDPAALDAAVASIRHATADAHQIAPCAVVLVAPGTLPKTTSGKLQRYLAREAFLTGDLRPLAQWQEREGLEPELERVAS